MLASFRCLLEESSGTSVCPSCRMSRHQWRLSRLSTLTVCNCMMLFLLVTKHLFAGDSEKQGVPPSSQCVHNSCATNAVKVMASVIHDSLCQREVPNIRTSSYLAGRSSVDQLGLVVRLAPQNKKSTCFVKDSWQREGYRRLPASRIHIDTRIDAE